MLIPYFLLILFSMLLTISQTISQIASEYFNAANFGEIRLSHNDQVAFIVDSIQKSGLYIFNISNPYKVKLIGSFYEGVNLIKYLELSKDEKRAYLLDSSNIFFIVDIGDLKNPRLISSYKNLSMDFLSMAYSADENFLFISSKTPTQGIYVFNVTNKTNPLLITGTSLTLMATTLTISSDDKTLFVTDDSINGVFLSLNVSVRSNITLNNAYILGSSRFIEFTLSIDEKTAYVLDSINKGLLIINTTDITNLSLIYNYLGVTNRLADVKVSPDEKTLFILSALPNLGLTVINITDPKSPRIIGRYLDLPGYFTKFAVSFKRDLTFISESNAKNGFMILNSSNVSNMISISKPGVNFVAMALIGDSTLVLFETSVYKGLVILNASNPDDIREIGLYKFTANVQIGHITISHDNKTAFVCLCNYGLLIINITDLSNPYNISRIITSSGNFVHSKLSKDARTLYISDSIAGRGLYVFDVSDVSTPFQVKSFTSSFLQLITLSADEEIAYLCTSQHIKAVNLTDMKELSTLSLGCVYSSNFQNNKYLLVMAGFRLTIINITNSSNLKTITVYDILPNTNSFSNAIFSVDEDKVLLTDSSIDGNLFIVRITNLYFIPVLNFKIPHTKLLTAAFSSNCDRLYLTAQSFGHALYVLNTSDLKEFCSSCKISGCISPEPICNLTTKRCESCLATGCKSLNEYCDQYTGACLPCNCSSSYYCNRTTGNCETCVINGCFSPTPYCNASSGRCYACDCNQSRYCDLYSGRCETCLVSGCISPSPYCNASSGRCYACNCNQSTYCNTSSGMCETCLLKGCSSPNPYCNASSGVCYACDCNGSHYCNMTSGLCETCLDTGCRSPTPYCNSTKGVCYGCRNDSEHFCNMTTGLYETNCQIIGCKEPTPYCNASSGICYACGCNNTQFCVNSSGYCHQVIFQLTMTPDYYYTSAKQYEATVTNMNITTGHALEWSLSQPIEFVRSGFNKIILQPNILPFFSKLLINVTDGPYTSQIFTINYNAPPIGGYLSVKPPQGMTLLTQYQIEAIGYEDIDLPLSYKFGYFYDSKNEISVTEDFSTNSQASIIFPSLPMQLSHNVTIAVRIKDNFDAISMSQNNTLCQEVSNEDFLKNSDSFLAKIITSSNTTDTNQLSQAVILFLDKLKLIESSSSSNVSTSCPSCTNQGKCPIDINQCFCLQEWTGSNCDIDLKDYNEIIKLKLTLLDAIKTIAGVSNSSNNSSSLIESLILISNNTDYNSKETINRVLNVLNSLLNISNPKTVISNQQILQTSALIDKSLHFLSESSCHIPLNESQLILNKSMSYLDILSHSLAENSNYSAKGVSIVEHNFELRTMTVSICALESLDIKSQSQLSPDLLLILNKSVVNSLDCSQNVSVNYLAMNSNLMSCNKSDLVYFSTISVKIIDKATGLKANVDPKVILKFKDPAFVVCSDSCQKEVLLCRCESLSYFDFKNQILSIFSKSQLSKIKFSDLEVERLIKSTGVWILITNSFIILLSVFLVSKIENYDLFAKSTSQNAKLSFLTKLKITYMVYL